MYSIKRYLLLGFFSICLCNPLNAQTDSYTISKDELFSKIYASWLGQMVGNIYGLPHENAYIDSPGPNNFPYGYGSNIDALRKYDGAFSDDDTDIEYMYLNQMQENGIEPTYRQLSQAWKYHIRNRVWLANRAALAAMHFGFTPPITGNKAYNPHWFQIDPQLVNEIWGVTAPGMVDYASKKSAWAAKITNDGWGIEPTIAYGAMYSTAFFEDDVRAVINAGMEALPSGSRFAKTIKTMIKIYEKYPGDWQRARQEMAEIYYHNEPVETRTIWNANLNGAAGILALLYGEGNFQETLDLACAMGFDADNQAATMSGLLALMKGKDAIPKNLLYPLSDANWEKPLNDKYVNITRHDLPDAKITEMAQATVEEAISVIVKNGGQKILKDGKAYFSINTDSQFEIPLEFSRYPQPELSKGEKVSYEFNTSIQSSKLKWAVKFGDLPPGLNIKDGKLMGVPQAEGIYPVTVEVSNGENSITKTFQLRVKGKNLAYEADEVISNVQKTDTTFRNDMWLTVSKDLYVNNVSAINDGNIRGEQSVYYSINGLLGPKKDYYGYKWKEAKDISTLLFYLGSMEESGGWFETLNVEYLNEKGDWKPVSNLRITPNLMEGTEQFNKPNFVHYKLQFNPVRTKGIRIIGKAGNAEHWKNKPAYFTSITELEVYN